MSVSDAEFDAWLSDPRADATRLILVEIDHAGGTVRLASDDWQSDAADGYRAYEGTLVEPLVMEDDLEDFAGVGDVVAYCPDPAAEDWSALLVRGYPCRWYAGDRRWPRADFRETLRVIVDEVRPVSERVVAFDLSDAGSVFERRPAGADETRSGSAESVIAALVADARADDAAAGTLTFTNVPPARLAWPVALELDARTTLGEALRRVAASLGAYVRARAGGSVDVFVPADAPEVYLDEDDLADEALRSVERVPARRRVAVRYGAADAREERPTGAATGAYDEEHELRSVLVAAADAASLAELLAARYAVRRDVREARVRSVAHRLEIGTRVHVASEAWTGAGIVRHIRREPDSAFSTVEILT